MVQIGDKVVLCGLVGQHSVKPQLGMGNAGTVKRIRTLLTPFEDYQDDTNQRVLSDDVIVDVELLTGEIVVVPLRHIQLPS